MRRHQDPAALDLLRNGEDQAVRVEARRKAAAFFELIMGEGGGINEIAHGAAFTPRHAPIEPP
jgi:hypothetical protein